MTLVNRVSAFFLAALAIVLVVYSGLFYAFVRGRLVQQFDQELHGALYSLVAAIEVEPEEVKWQPLEHAIALGSGDGPEEVRWVVIGDGAQIVEHSRNSTPEIIAEAKRIVAETHEGNQTYGELTAPGEWSILYRRLIAPDPIRQARELDEFDELVVVVARSTADMDANLQRLLILVILLPLAAWLLAAALGRWFGARALRPVLEMSQRARSIAGSDFKSRLPAPESGDELADLGQSFNTLLDRQQRAYEQQRRFAGDAAHELRTPLTVLLGQMDVALRRPRSAEEYAETLGVLRDEANELQQIVESLLFLARTSEDATLPGSEPIELAEWLPRYMERWQNDPRRSDLRLELQFPSDATASAPPALLNRLLDNLISNAAKYSAPGTPITVTATGNADAAAISVTDQGRGISPEDQATVFEPFFRSKSARDAGIAGTGLGLAIASRIVAALGGKLECDSELGRGSKFTLTLPTLQPRALPGGSVAEQSVLRDGDLPPGGARG
ncbi:ATP-binding protein [Lacipirellula sp.]|uniref:sensor histidine kinase n=1 Tax=Lacipirellula sp. TaxID=2691419 RepID=UPI003D0B9FFE